MIIGISGKIGSGKDTVGALIQHLIAVKLGIAYNSKDAESAFETIKNHEMLPIETHHVTGWTIKKFAAKLKETVALLTGCTVEQLEDQEFKNSYLPEEWNQFIKVEFPEYGEAKPTGEQIADSDSILVRTTHRRITYREMLQKVGTEAMRDNVHTNVWCNALFSNYKKNMQKSSSYYDAINLSFPNWIITDMRFPNELQAVKDREGITIRINRYLTKKTFSEDGLTSMQGVMVDFNEHPSETALDNSEFDFTIDNDGTIEELVEKVREILIKVNIL